MVKAIRRVFSQTGQRRFAPALKGRHETAQGNALGSPFSLSQALEGRNARRRDAPLIIPPFQGLLGGGNETRGVALGFPIAPLRGWRNTETLFTAGARGINKLQRRGGVSEPGPVPEDQDFLRTGLFARPDFRAMHFIEQRYCGDPGNWWIPDRACAEAMLRSAGFTILNHPEEEVYICRANPQEDRRP